MIFFSYYHPVQNMQGSHKLDLPKQTGTALDSYQVINKLMNEFVRME